MYYKHYAVLGESTSARMKVELH